MKVEFLNKYSVTKTTPKYVEFTYEGVSDEVLNDFLVWVGTDRYDCEAELKESLEYYINGYCDLVPSTLDPNMEILDYSLEFKILNWPDIFSEISYLVGPQEKVSCCNKAPFGANFCPTCGKPIIKN